MRWLVRQSWSANPATAGKPSIPLRAGLVKRGRMRRRQIVRRGLLAQRGGIAELLITSTGSPGIGFTSSGTQKF
jgi:hypothetical protein